MPKIQLNGSERWFCHLHHFFIHQQILYFPCEKKKSFSGKPNRYYWINVPFIELSPKGERAIVLNKKRESIREVEQAVQEMIYDKLSYQINTYQQFYLPNIPAPRTSKIAVNIGALLKKTVFKNGFLNIVNERLATQGVYFRIWKFLDTFEHLFSENHLLMSELFAQGNFSPALLCMIPSYGRYFSEKANQSNPSDLDLTAKEQHVREHREKNKQYLNNIKHRLQYYPYLLNQLICFFDLIHHQKLLESFIFFKNELKKLLDSLRDDGLNLNEKTVLTQELWVKYSENIDLNQEITEKAPLASPRFFMASSSDNANTSPRFSQSPRTMQHYHSIREHINASETGIELYDNIRLLQQFILKYPLLNPVQQQISRLVPLNKIALTPWLLGALSNEQQSEMISLLKTIFLLDPSSGVDVAHQGINKLIQRVYSRYQEVLAEQQAVKNAHQFLDIYKKNINEIIKESPFWFAYIEKFSSNGFLMIPIEPIKVILDEELNKLSQRLKSEQLPEIHELKKQNIDILRMYNQFQALTRNANYMKFKAENRETVLFPSEWLHPPYIEALNIEIDRLNNFMKGQQFNNKNDQLLALSFLLECLHQLNDALLKLIENEQQEQRLSACST